MATAIGDIRKRLEALRLKCAAVQGQAEGLTKLADNLQLQFGRKTSLICVEIVHADSEARQIAKAAVLQARSLTKLIDALKSNPKGVRSMGRAEVPHDNPTIGKTAGELLARLWPGTTVDRLLTRPDDGKKLCVETRKKLGRSLDDEQILQALINARKRGDLPRVVKR
jgi:hypothetical protein